MKDPDTLLSTLLADTPPVPDRLFDEVLVAMARRRSVERMVWSAAAALLLAAGLFTMFHTMPPRIAPQTATTPPAQSVVDELQTAHDYLSGADIESDLAMYVSMSD